MKKYQPYSFKSLASAAGFFAALLLAACGGGTNTAGAPAGAVTAEARATDLVSVNDGKGGVRAAKGSADGYAQPSSPERNQSVMDIQKRKAKPVITTVDLGNVDASKGAQMRQNQTELGAGKAMQVGFARDVLQAKDSASTAQLLQWAPSAEGGQIAAIAFKSGGAEGMRIGLVVQALSPQATVRFYESGSGTAVDVSGKLINETIARNVAAGDTSEDGRTYWGPYLKGASGTLEIELPKDVPIASISLAVPRISHFFLDPLGKQSLTGGLQKDDSDGAKAIGGSGTCNLDVSCSTPVSTASKAVAQMVFVQQGSSFVCTGTLLNNSQSDGIPYFLTAYHCISQQTVASSLITNWFFRSSGCNNGQLNPNYVRQTGGATLLYTRVDVSGASGASPVGTDTSFMRLNTAPPAGAWFSGWSAARQSIFNGITYTGVHHPDGDLQKYSLGRITAYSYLQSNGRTSSNSTSTDYGMYQVVWSGGTTEGGSSGSGLFLDGNTANPKLVGQLFGGSSSCFALSSPDVYGRFDLAFKEGVANWLSPNTGAAYRFYNSASNSYFWSISNSEVQTILDSYPQFKYEGLAYFASTSGGNGFLPVYRFRNKVNGSYLWTIDQGERNSIRQNYSTIFVEEGIAWYANQAPVAGYLPLYRFRDFTNSTYFYTASESEKNSLLSIYANRFVFEGVAYYVRGS